MPTVMNSQASHGLGWSLVRFIFLFFPLIMSLVGCLEITLTLFLKENHELWIFSNGAFLIVTTLAILAFSYAQVFSSEKAERRHIVSAGECFSAGAMLLLFSLILRNVIIIPETIVFGNPDKPGFAAVFLPILAVIATVMFVVSIVLAHWGLWKMGNILLRRRAV